MRGGAHLLRLTLSMFITIVVLFPNSCQRIEEYKPHILAMETRNKANQATEIRVRFHCERYLYHWYCFTSIGITPFCVNGMQPYIKLNFLQPNVNPIAFS